jgi:16S rRNA (guanine(527)-N(7))-methyltransferase RsmG
MQAGQSRFIVDSQFPMDLREKKKINAILDSCGIVRAVGLAESIQTYLSLLDHWNRKLNLTRARGLEEMIRLHFAESFYGAMLMQPGEGPVLDVGSGAGFPGMGMRLMLPGEVFYLVESRMKKAAFLSTIRRELKLSGVTVMNYPLQLCQPEMFALPPRLLTFRAVGNPAEIVREAGRLLSYPAAILLFTTDSLAGSICERLSQIQWLPKIPIPWSREKVLLKGAWPFPGQTNHRLA